MQYITALELKKKCDNKENVVVVDIRESYELDICKFKAIHIPMEDIIKRIDELDPKVESVVVCKTGKRAEAAANLLIQEYDFSNLKVLEGGMLSWIENVETHLEVY
jgi:adenylyltransferase/sulfurtransferase